MWIGTIVLPTRMWSIFAYGAQTIVLSSHASSLVKRPDEEALSLTRDASVKRDSATPYCMVGTIQLSLIETISTTELSCAENLSLAGNGQILPTPQKKIKDIKSQLEQAQLNENFSNEAILNLKWNICAAFRNEELYWKQGPKYKTFSRHYQAAESEEPCLKATPIKWYLGGHGRRPGTSGHRLFSNFVHFIKPLGF